MNNSLEKFLPIGTVVLLKNSKKRLMITGFCVYDMIKKDKVYDYSGCAYPEGIVDSKKMALFDHSQISKVYYLGYQDQEQQAFKKSLIDKILNIIKKQQNK